MKKIFLISVLSVIIFLLRVNIISFAERIMKEADTIKDSITFKPNAVIDYPEVNIREKSTSKGKRIGSLKQGSKIYVVNQDANDGWLKIEYTPGKFAYIFSAYVRFMNQQDNKLQQVGVISRSSDVYDSFLNKLFRVKTGERVIVISSIDADRTQIIAPLGRGILPSKCIEVMG